MDMKINVFLIVIIFSLTGCQLDNSIKKEDNNKIDRQTRDFQSESDSKVFIIIQIVKTGNLEPIKILQQMNEDLRVSDFNGHSEFGDFKYILVKGFDTNKQIQTFIEETRNSKLFENPQIVPISQYNLRVLLSDSSRFSEYQKFYAKEIKEK